MAKTIHISAKQATLEIGNPSKKTIIRRKKKIKDNEIKNIKQKRDTYV